MNDTNVNILTGEYVNLHYKKASVLRRFVAVIIDWIMLGVFAYIFSKLQISTVFFYTATFISLLSEYFSKGFTIGKFILKIRVISDQCTPPSFLQCFLRWALFPIDFWMVGVILIANKGQRLGDITSGCQCIYLSEKGQKKVKLFDEFHYADPNYKVRFPEVAKLKPETIKRIEHILFYDGFSNLKTDMFINLKKWLKINHSINEDQLLEQVYNDYKYLKINNKITSN